MAETSDELKELRAGRKATRFEKRRQAWENTRQRGRKSFILRRGVLGWGGFMFIFMTCMSIFIDHRKIDWHYVIISLIIWPLAGYGYGLSMWCWAEERFHGSDTKPPSIIEN
jgi:hypothetical protein